MFVSRVQSWLMTTNRLVCVTLLTGALVMCQKYSKISRLLKLLIKNACSE
jgi:hypothetical protein